MISLKFLFPILLFCEQVRFLTNCYLKTYKKNDNAQTFVYIIVWKWLPSMFQFLHICIFFLNLFITAKSLTYSSLKYFVICLIYFSFHLSPRWFRKNFCTWQNLRFIMNFWASFLSSVFTSEVLKVMCVYYYQAIPIYRYIIW